MFITINVLWLLLLKILDLANNIILAIKILKIINVDDRRSMLENDDIDKSELNDKNQTIENGVMIRSVAMLIHQYRLDIENIVVIERRISISFSIYLFLVILSCLSHRNGT
jgi:hypothetical protein